MVFEILLIVLLFAICYIFFKKSKSEVELAISKTPNLALLVVDKALKIRFISKKFETIFCLSSKFYLNQDFENLVQNLTEFKEIKGIFTISKSQNIREKIVKKDDNYYRVCVSSVLKEAKEFDGFIVTIADVTSEKKLQKERLKHEQMLKLNAKMSSLGEMVSAISHQQRSPISAVMLSLDEIDECVMSGDTNGVLTHVNRAKSAVLLLDETVRAFAKFYKNDDRISEIDLNELVYSLSFIIKPRLNHHGINMSVIVADENLKIKSISAYIKQILLSLIANSSDELIKKFEVDSDFNPEILLSLQRFDDEICISVSDNADGIRDDSRIFEPFYTDKKDGTGMGLYVAHELSQKLDARLVLKSKKAPTTFCLYLKIV